MDEFAEATLDEDLSSGDLQCRMYEAKFPEVDDIVMVQVKSIAEMGAYVSLLEYDQIEVGRAPMAPMRADGLVVCRA
jgi:hypothetical protein